MNEPDHSIPGAVSAAARETSILVIDDREENRVLIRYLFDQPEYRVLEAADGAAGLTLAHAENPDCILLDLTMPGLSGFEVLERLAANPRTREIPVIILTATDERIETMERAFRHGAVDYITKPISPPRVAVRVRGAIERRRLLQEVQDLRASFTSMLVHDLRAPLTVMSAYVDLLEQGAAGPVTAKQQMYLQRLRTSALDMGQLIREILDLSKLEAGKLSMKLTPMDLGAAAADVADRFAPAASQKGIRLRVETPDHPVWVLADSGRMDQVLMNLLSNALKFTPEGGTIDVTLGEVGDLAEIRVIDSGPGIPADEVSLLFEKFGQATAGKKLLAGSGLGLVICRHLVEAHNGRIWVETQAGPGARFVFQLPRMADAPDRSPAASSRTVLIVDDEPSVAMVLKDLLARQGHRVEIAPGGRQALSRLEAHPYDVIVSDIRMPELDGPGLYRAVEQWKPELCRRFIFMTGYDLTPEARHLIQARAVPVLTKPFGPDQIDELIRQLLRVPTTPSA